jgi:hypothetical protein
MSNQKSQHAEIDSQSLQEALHQLLEQITRRDQKLSWIKAEKTAAAQAFSEREQTLLNKIAEGDAVLHYTQIQLHDREAQLKEILSSRSWKIALFLQRIRTLLVPPQRR